MIGVFLIIVLAFSMIGCSKNDKNMHQIEIGNTFSKAVKIEVISFGSDLEEKDETASVIELDLKVTNIGELPIDTLKDLQIEVNQGDTPLVPIKNTLLENSTIEPQHIIESELVIEIRPGEEEEIQIKYKLDGRTKGFTISIKHPVRIK